MSKRFYLLAIILLASVNLFAQGIRVPGYIIKANGDTLRGFVVDRKDNWHVNEIEFASSESSATEKYPVPDIKGFYLESYKVFYRSAVTEIDIKPVDLEHVEPHNTRNLVVDTLLLERVVAGPLSLYKYEGKRLKQHFFVEKDGVLTELPFVRYQGSTGVVNSKLYVYTLKTLTSDCDDSFISPATEYTAAALTKFVKRYNECVTGKKSERARASLRMSATIFAGVGVAAVNLTGGADGNYYYIGNYGSSPNFMGGLRMDLVSKRETNRHRLGVQAFYSQYSKVSHENTTGLITRHYSIEFSAMQYGFLYRYTFWSARRLNPYLQLELNLVNTRGSGGTWYYTDVMGIPHEGTFSKLSKLGIGGAPAFGVVFNKNISADIRLRYLPLATDTGFNKAIITGPEITLGYSVF